MCKKTVIKRASKTWPKNDRLNSAIEHLNVELDEGIEFTSRSGSGSHDAASKELEARKAKVREEIVSKLTQVAKEEGIDSLEQKISMLNKSHMSLVEADLDRIRGMASATVEGEYAEVANG